MPLLIDGIREKSYFEKLRSSVEHRRNAKDTPHLTAANVSTSSENPLDNALENLVESMQLHNKSSSENSNHGQSHTDIVLNQLESLKQIYIDNEFIKSAETSTPNCFDASVLSMMTPHGRILFDFSKQLMNDEIYIQLMQLVRLANLDKLIQKIFHQSGEYYHIDYKEKRRKQLQKEQHHRENSSKNQSNSHVVSPIHNKYYLSDNHNRLRSYELDKTNSYITMAKAVHFRASSHCFILDNIDISPRFQYDWKILQDTCFHYRNHRDRDSNTKHPKIEDSQPITSSIDSKTNSTEFRMNQMSYEHLSSSIHQLCVDSKRTIPLILVLCTERMKQTYQLLASLLKPYISSDISVVYITFEQIEPFLKKYQPNPLETLHESSVFRNFYATMMTKDNQFDSNPIVLSANVSTKVLNDENSTDKDVLNPSFRIDGMKDKVDLSNEELLLNYLRTSSLILIFMKNFDETYFTAFIHWYLLASDPPSKMDWTSTIEHFWLITSDYQRAQTLFSIPKSNVFLWPTELNDFDHLSIVLSSILILPIAFNITYQIYTEFIDGLVIIDKHCQQTSIDQNVCIRMALLRLWLTICERQTIGIVTNDDRLQHFGEYLQILLTEYNRTYDYPLVSSIGNFVEQLSNKQNHFSYDLIMICDESNSSIRKTDIIGGQVLSLLNDSIKSEAKDVLNTQHPHTFILLDQFTPVTLGVLCGVYQMSIFFENIIHEHIYESTNQSSFLYSLKAISHRFNSSNQMKPTQD